MRSWREHLLGPPERLEPAGLLRVLRRGDAGLRIRAARVLPQALHADHAGRLLADPTPGVRRAFARAYVGPVGPLQTALRAERCVSVAAELRRALERLGHPAEPAPDLRLLTHGGPRSPETAIDGLPRIPLTVPRPGQLTALRDTLGRDPEQPSALLDLGQLGAPQDHDLLQRLRPALGKRSENAWLLALGLLGDPRARGLLERQLTRMDVDPGRGFALRRLSALALGRIGDPSAADALVRALEIEALEHEGRPGAGLGVQYPVRAVLLWALGEVGARAHAPTLLSYLGASQVGTMGGLHVAAMGALYKLGAAAEPGLRQVAQGQGPAAENARGTLAGALRESSS